MARATSPRCIYAPKALGFLAALVVALGISSSTLSADANTRDLLHYKQCAPEDGGGVCTVGSTCCRAVDNHVTTSRCIPTYFGSTCCSDKVGEDGIGPMFCFAGYDCTSSDGSTDADATSCARNSSKPQLKYSRRFDDVIPQYATCHAAPEALELVHGLPVPTADDLDGRRSSHRLAYFSTDGDLLDISLERALELQAAVVVVHGYRVDQAANDYFCATVEVSKLQDYYPKDSVLVVAPWFQVEDECKTPLTTGGEAMRWSKEDRLQGWPYGSSAHDPESARNVSSFDAIDAVVTALADRRHFPNLDLITVVGNCNGAELVQRWVLFSGITAWEGDSHRRPEEEEVENRRQKNDSNRHADQQRDAPRIRSVLVNPTELTYLATDRYQDGRRIRDKMLRGRCKNYNDYPFGLEFPTRPMPHVEATMTLFDGWTQPVPYVDATMAHFDGSTKDLAQRYSSRDVIYVASLLDLDRKFVHCPSLFQGRNNLEVSVNFQDHLKTAFPDKEVHRLLTVEGVEHDFALVLQQEIGLLALFGGNGRCPRFVS